MEASILQNYAAMGNMRMIAGDMVVMAIHSAFRHHDNFPNANDEESANFEENRLQYAAELKISTKYQSLAQEYRQFVQQ